MDNLSKDQIKQLKKQIQQIYRSNFKKIDYNQFERPYDCINILDNKVKANIQKIKNDTYRFDNQFIKQREYTERVSQIRVQSIKYEQMKAQLKTRIQKGLEPRLLNKLNNELDKISKLQGVAQIQEFKINYDKYTNENDNTLQTIRKDFKLDQIDLNYINSFEDFQNNFNSKIPFEIITDAPYMGLYYGKCNYQDTYVFANIRYIKQNGNIIPIGFIIQNQMSSLLESIFEEVMDNGEKYFNRDVKNTDVMLFQNIGVINVQVISSEQIVQKVCKEKDEFYVSKVYRQYDEGSQIGLICRNVGHRYQGNATLEQKFKGSIFFVKNNDHNCLYAAIIATFTKKSKTVDKKHIFQLGAKPYAMATIVFDAGKALQTYLDKPLDKTQARNQYLQYYTHMLINEINKDAEELADTEILIRAERYLNIKIRVAEVNKVNDLYPNSEMELLLVLCSGHYNVIMDFKQCINTINPMHKEYIYCYQHQNLFHKKNQCYECTQAEEVATKYYCTFCNYSHVRSKDNKSYQCQNCRTQLHNTPNSKCLERHQKQCEKFSPCSHCNTTHNSSRKCKTQIEYEGQYFKQGNLYDEQKSFLTWDIESLFDNLNEDDDNYSNYSMKHIPFLVIWIINIHDKETKPYEEMDHFYDNALRLKEPGSYMTSTDDLLIKFIRHMEPIAKKYKIKDFYAHNAAAYDKYLLLAAIMKVKEQFEFETLITNNKLLNLKINGMSFKDSFRLITSPLSKLNKELALGLEVGKQLQSYTFLTKEIFDLYIQNGGSLKSISELVKEGILQHKYFDKLSLDEFNQYANDYDHLDFIDQYINYCIQDSSFQAKLL